MGGFAYSCRAGDTDHSRYHRPSGSARGDGACGVGALARAQGATASLSRSVSARAQREPPMSNYLAVATVTGTLQHVLSAAAAVVPGAKVSTTRPDGAAPAAKEPAINVFLYQ